jgi:Fe-Mn family superoxide dismutase
MNSSRRKFLTTLLKTSTVATIGTAEFLKPTVSLAKERSAPLRFSQIELPYSFSSLEPNIDALTMEIHYSKHHSNYVKNVNEALETEKLNFASEKDFFDNSSRLTPRIRNNGGGAWNHNFFWKCMKPEGREVHGKIKEAIIGSFGSTEKFKDLFLQRTLAHFGSGWIWLVKSENELKIGSTPNQDNPLMEDSNFKGIPLLSLDVWEHAYYLKYQNKRSDYLNNWWNVINWDEVSSRL